MWEIVREMRDVMLTYSQEAVKVQAMSDIVAFQKNVVTSFERDDMANLHLWPCMYRCIVKFEVGNHVLWSQKICLQEDSGGKHKMRPLKAT